MPRAYAGTNGIALAAPSPACVCGRARRGTRALAQRRLQIGRAPMFVQQVAKGLVGELLEGFHRLVPEQVERLPGLGIEFHELAPRIGWLLHDTLLHPSEPSLAPDRSSHEDAMVKKKGAQPAA